MSVGGTSVLAATSSPGDANRAENLSIRLRLSEIIPETADALSLVFRPADPQASAPAYRPGQFLTLRIPRGSDGYIARCYSLASSPYRDENLKVTVKRTVGGHGSNWLCDNATIGLELDALAPAGAFSPKDLDRDFLLIAAGSGITPIMSILTSALLKGSGKIALVYVNRDERSVIFDAELQHLVRSHPERLTMHHWRTAEAGRLTGAKLKAITIPYAAFEVFVCGPRGFMDEARQALIENGVAPKRIVLEEFASLTTNPFNPAAAMIAPSDDRPTVDVKVDLYGVIHHLAWPEDTLLLDLLLSRNIDVPYLCRVGACHTCTCTLETGRIRILEDGVVDANGANALILACQTLPDGTDATIRFLDS